MGIKLSDFTPSCWCTINAAGEITKLDWDEAERLAELHRAGQRNESIACAVLAIAVRESVLKTIIK